LLPFVGARLRATMELLAMDGATQIVSALASTSPCPRSAPRPPAGARTGRPSPRR